MQLDMFAPAPVEPQLPVARVHPLNPRAFDMSDCHREVIECGHGITVTIRIARCADGLFRSTAGYYSNTGGCGGPVFHSDHASTTFGEARAQALLGLVERLQTSYSSSSDITHKRLLKKIEAIPLDFWTIPA